MVRATLAVILALAGCEQHPSKLDVLPDDRDVRVAEMQAWGAIEERALPMSIRNDLLQIAVALPDRGTVDERAAALIAWMDAGGSVPVPTTMAAFNSPTFTFYVTRIVELVTARPNDDRLFEAALYGAWKLRRDGLGYIAATSARVITDTLAGLREVPPAFAAKYAPTDAEVFRLFASEAMFTRRTTFELDDVESAAESAAALALWRDFATAPTERAAFLAFADRMIAVHPGRWGAAQLREYGQRMFAAVDTYQAWLSRRPPAPGP